MEIKFNELVIICNGINTSIVADGVDLARGCTKIVFEHSANEEGNRITLTRDVKLTASEQ